MFFLASPSIQYLPAQNMRRISVVKVCCWNPDQNSDRPEPCDGYLDSCVDFLLA